MNYLLDSDVIISHVLKKAYISNKVISHSAGMSIVTYGEIWYGIKKRNIEQREKEFHDLIKDLKLSILPLVKNTIEQFVKVKIFLETKGEKLADFDTLIAATALEHDLILVTANKRHFSRIPGLKLA